MSAANRANDTLMRALPFVVAAVIVLLGYMWFIQPNVTEILRSRNDATSLEARVRVLQDTVDRAKRGGSPDESSALRTFEARMSADDCVSEVVERMVHAALESAPKGKVKALQVATGESAHWAPTQAGAMARGGDMVTDQPDPRFGLFPVSVTYTPVTVAFDASYEAIERFVWQLRDMPTMIEIRSMELTRDLPLMHAVVRVYVYQRGGAVQKPVAPQGATPAGQQSTAPRVARLSLSEGW